MIMIIFLVKESFLCTIPITPAVPMASEASPSSIAPPATHAALQSTVPATTGVPAVSPVLSAASFVT